jgi:preprotein translocase subunit SecD
VLYSYGSGPIRGFAVTLLVGIVSNLLTSVWMSRWMFDLIVGRRGSVSATLSI